MILLNLGIMILKRQRRENPNKTFLLINYKSRKKFMNWNMKM